MNVDELLESLDQLRDRERLRRVAAWAPTATDRAALLDHGEYGRRLALVAGLVARDVRLIKASGGPVPLLRAGLFDRRITELSSRDRRKTARPPR
ncbi:hypothetical protein [Actinoplanes solisilvae]|uniref:hypothetical protein n=1 Tax=Actinoplanes solisilvae TaxID=2486853 RepID=UPI000FDB6307|nr:hypothetical protein [Actinoplanes solisilvae]